MENSESPIVDRVNRSIPPVRMCFMSCTNTSWARVLVYSALLVVFNFIMDETPRNRCRQLTRELMRIDEAAYETLKSNPSDQKSYPKPVLLSVTCNTIIKLHRLEQITLMSIMGWSGCLQILDNLLRQQFGGARNWTVCKLRHALLIFSQCLIY